MGSFRYVWAFSRSSALGNAPIRTCPRSLCGFLGGSAGPLLSLVQSYMAKGFLGTSTLLTL